MCVQNVTERRLRQGDARATRCQSDADKCGRFEARCQPGELNSQGGLPAERIQGRLALGWLAGGLPGCV